MGCVGVCAATQCVHNLCRTDEAKQGGVGEPSMCCAVLHEIGH